MFAIVKVARILNLTSLNLLFLGPIILDCLIDSTGMVFQYHAHFRFAFRMERQRVCFI
jgi:hypothetical protein